MLKTVLIISLSTMVSVGVNADITTKSSIRQILYNGTTEVAFFTKDSSWEVKNSSGSVVCTPNYVQIKSSVVGRDKLLSIALAAKMAGGEVDFLGECNGDPNYFDAYYIRLY